MRRVKSGGLGGGGRARDALSQAADPPVLIARLHDLHDYSRLVDRGFRLVASALRSGEEEWLAGEWSWEPRKKLHVTNLYELGFAAPGHRQEPHRHPDAYEVIIFLGEGVVEYLAGGRACFEEVRVEAGDAAIIPPGVWHRVRVERVGLYAFIVPGGARKEVWSGGWGRCGGGRDAGGGGGGAPRGSSGR